MEKKSGCSGHTKPHWTEIGRSDVCELTETVSSPEEAALLKSQVSGLWLEGWCFA